MYNCRNFDLLSSQRDYGGSPFLTYINCLARSNDNYRTALWTGEYLQTTLMSIPPDGDIGLEQHKDTDQMIMVSRGTGLVQMGNSEDNLTVEQRIGEGGCVFVPAGMWHNITNVGSTPLKLCSVYAPTEHPFGTVEQTKPEK